MYIAMVVGLVDAALASGPVVLSYKVHVGLGSATATLAHSLYQLLHLRYDEHRGRQPHQECQVFDGDRLRLKDDLEWREEYDQQLPHH